MSPNAMSQERDLPVPDDMTTQQREWTFERIGWCAMLLVILAAAVGLLGPGLLSHTRAAAPDATVVVEYEQHLRKGAPAELRVELLAQALAADEVKLAFDQAYLERMDLVRIVPEPGRAEVATDATEFFFQLARTPRNGVITFYFEPEEPATAEGTLRVNAGPGVPLRHIIFP